MAFRDRSHIIVPRPAQVEPFKPPRRKISPKELPTPADRLAHGNRLTAELNAARAQGLTRREQCTVSIPERAEGIYVVFESFPGLELALESLDPRRGKRHPELVSVRVHEVDGVLVERATVHIPDGTLGHFLKRLKEYMDSVGQAKPKNSPLVDRVRSIALASLRELWTDPPDEFPDDNQRVWWELWLRRRDGQELTKLAAFAEAVGARQARRTLSFAKRTVLLIEATGTQLTQALDVLDDLAELRRPKEPTAILAAETASEQAAWVKQLAERTTAAREDAPAACIVDTGVYRPHPLLAPSLSAADCHACDRAWGTSDHHGHGTEMAGLALYGDLGSALLDANPVFLRHRLESVKLLPPPPTENPPELYGAVTATAASRVEIVEPRRRRVFSMAITAPWQTIPIPALADVILGQPSSWSAAIDALAAGLSIDVSDGNILFLDPGEETARRLFVLSTGNVTEFDEDHLARSDISPVEDPAQAWNALAVGAYTARDSLADAPNDFDGWTPVAPRGELSPFSRTSVAFGRGWPVKPDVVLEGGNLARSPAGTQFDTPDVLQILTTKAPLRDTRLLTITQATSAASAQAARIAALILADYPSLWPETVRALIVHSAEWTPAMRRRFNNASTRRPRVALLRRYGMGVPDLLRATRSATDALTLIVQDTILPFDSEGRMREMHLHDLPWPAQALADLGAVEVRLRITLSYFIEPNPGARGWVRRYSYASHGLRFDVRRRTESTDDFRKRINEKALAEEERRPRGESDAVQWFFGPDYRVTGSLHTDIWTGQAVDLAQRGVVAVFPVAGWWKHNKAQDDAERKTRYALIVSIETPGVDIWTPVAQEIGIPIEV